MCISRVLLVLAAAAIVLPAQTSLKSPDGNIELTIATLRGKATAESGQLAYRVTFNGKAVIEWSNLGLDIQGAPPLGTDMRVTAAPASSADGTWTALHGKSSTIRDHYNAVTVQAAETARMRRALHLEARAYDDGVAFRYYLPGGGAPQEVRIAGELTQFHFAKDGASYPLIFRNYRTSYEDDYHELPVGGLHPEYLIALPFLAEVPGVGWVGVTEAFIDNYAGLYLGAGRDSLTLEAKLAPRVDEPGLAVAAATPLHSPWRVLMIGREAGRLVESNIVLNLNPPSAIADTSWIKPGKTSWDWWSGSVARKVDFESGMNTATMKHYIDFSSRNHLEYMLVDAGWAYAGTGANDSGADLTRTSANIDMPELLRYAKSKNVRLWLWAHWTDVNRQIDEAFPLFEKWGVAGVKIDFMDRDDQWMVNWYRRVAKKAAEHHLMLDYHGAFKPDGLRRTYPNVLTREGVMGLEYSKWSGRITPKHNVTLAFTRMLAGPMDYTPGGFENVTRADFQPRNKFPMVMGTRAHETALYVVFESAFQMLADDPGAYEGQKELEFLRAVPAAWNETRVVSGVPAKYIAIARRHGDEWYAGAITDWDARDIDLPLAFLGKGSYTAVIFSDGPEAAVQPKDSKRDERKVDSSTVLKLKLAPGGGAAIRFVPAK